MKMLAIDASTDLISIAIDDGQSHRLRTWTADRKHSSQLAVTIAEEIRTIGLSVEALEAVVVGTGPGSYTGIRVGLAVAKGLALGADVPLVGISGLEARAFALGSCAGPICALAFLGAGRWGVGLFSGPWQNWRRMANDVGVETEKVASLIPEGAVVCGVPEALTLPLPDSVTVAPTFLGSVQADTLIYLGRRQLESHGTHDLPAAVPNYLRLSTPEEKLREAERMDGAQPGS